MNLNSPTLCAYPWSHLYIDPSGDVRPCCLSKNPSGTLGNVKKSTVEDIWNSDKMKKIRLQMLKGESPPSCEHCLMGDKANAFNARKVSLLRFGREIENIETLEDGTVPVVNLKYWDFRLTTLCNFKCRTCWRGYSSKWLKEDLERNVISENQVGSYNVHNINGKPNIEFLKKYIGGVEWIYFAGGEPLITQEHWDIMSFLVENKKFDTQIQYSTNLSNLIYKGKHILDYWKLWGSKKIILSVSIDEINERAELVRHGTKWSLVEKNLFEILNKPFINIIPAVTVSCLNISRVDVILDYLIDKGLHAVDLNVISGPPHYTSAVLDLPYRLQLKQKYEKKFLHDEKYKHINFNFLWAALTAPFDLNLAHSFLKITKNLDNHRGEDTFKILPELKRIKNFLDN